MRRFLLAFSLLAGVLLSTPATHAAGTQHGYQHQTVSSGAITSAPQLKESSSVYPPNFQVAISQPVNASSADQSYFGTLHSITYENLGMLFGWLQIAAMGLPSGNAFLLAYLASGYSSPDVATTAFDDASSAWTSGTAAVCSFPGAIQCVQVTIQNAIMISGLPYTAVMRILLKSNTIWEGGYLLEQDDFAANKSAGDQYANALANGYIALFNAPTATPVPTPVSTPAVTPTPSPTLVTGPPPTTTPTPTTRTEFSIITVRFEKPKAQPSLNDAVLTKAKSGTKVELVGFLEVKSAPPGLPFTTSFQITEGGKVVAHVAGSGQLDAADPTGIYTLPARYKLPKKVGTYVGTVTVTMNGQTEQGSARIKDTGKKKA